MASEHNKAVLRLFDLLNLYRRLRVCRLGSWVLENLLQICEISQMDDPVV